jgi:hypothetical protein
MVEHRYLWPFVITAVVFLAVTFVSQYFYEEYLWFKSVDSWIPGLQGVTWWPWKSFVMFISWFGWEILWLFVIAFIAKFNRVTCIYLCQNMTFMMYFATIFKIWWNDPAPYMHRGYINAYECDQNTFQNPSLEVTMSAFGYSMMFYLAYDWIEAERKRTRVSGDANRGTENQPLFEDQDNEWYLSDNQQYAKTRSNDMSFWFVLTLVIYTVFMVGYAGMYNGINSFDQVLFGMCIGYAFFCIFYYAVKDIWVRDLTLTSERREHVPTIASWYVSHVVVIAIMIGLARLFYYYQTQDYTINPRWKANHKDDCGLLPFPSFFDKEMLNIYRFLYLNLGLVLGYGFDSLVLGGTRVDFNQQRKSEGGNPTVGFLIRFFLILGWVLLNVWGFQSLMGLVVHKWLFVLAIPYFTAGFPIFSFMKYVFKLLGATRPEISPPIEMGAVGLRQAERPHAQ